jgi:hypothetical protein
MYVANRRGRRRPVRFSVAFVVTLLLCAIGAPPAAAATVPGAPASANAVGGNKSATVNWTPPASDGGTVITSYRIVVDTGPLPTSPPTACTPTATSLTTSADARGIVVTGLTNGTTYAFDVSAGNAIGYGPTTRTNVVTPNPTVPAAPTGVLATRGDRQATLSWTPPTDDGGSAITGYKIVAFAVGSGTTTTYFVSGAVVRTTITGLTNGTTYTFDVSAGNCTGPPPGSAPCPTTGGSIAYGPAGTSNPVTPATVPGDPTSVTATGRYQSAIVSWTAPTSDGGDPLTGYRIEVSAGGLVIKNVTVGGSTTSTTVDGLTNGTVHTFKIFAVNTVGSSASACPTPTSGSCTQATPNPTPPAAPTGVTASRGNTQATVSWTAPVDTGGSAIADYHVALNCISPTTGPGCGTFVTVTGTTYTWTGLTNGNTYSFSVSARNAVTPGYGPAATSNNVTPATVPGAPTGVGTTLGDGAVTVNWIAPSSNGGDPITGYKIVVNCTAPAGCTPNGTTVSVGGSATRGVVDGLSNGNTYTFSVSAGNTVGFGTATTSGPARPGPRFTLTSGSLDYGDGIIGSASATRVITVTNVGSADLAISAVSAVTTSPTPPAANFAVVSDTCSGNITPAGSTCQVELSFTPVVRGSITGTFSVTSNSIGGGAGGGTTAGPDPTLSLAGRGVGPAISYSPTSLAFGNQAVGTESALQMVTITNNAPAATARDLHINSISIEGFGAPNYVVDQASDLCTAATLAAGQSCTVGIKFAPIRTGPADATLRVEHDAYVDPPRVTLSGSGT